ncbi:MAG: hypothetical protein AAFQ80_17850 [Cyanobacteria bacterium J06621_8]
MINLKSELYVILCSAVSDIAVHRRAKKRLGSACKNYPNQDKLQEPDFDWQLYTTARVS